MRILRYWLILAIGTFLAAYLIPGISYGGDWGTLLLVVLILSVLNVLLKPLLILFTLPFILLTLGLGIWLINGLLLYLASRIVDTFHVDSFLVALLGSLVISFTHFVANRLFERQPRQGKVFKGRKDDVIDV